MIPVIVAILWLLSLICWLVGQTSLPNSAIWTKVAMVLLYLALGGVILTWWVAS